MNQIDQLISQAGIQGTFDVRCLYRGGFRLPHEQSPAGVMPFHLLMKGEIRVSTAQGDDVVLRPGDLLLLPGGEPHTIWREGDALALAEPGDGLLPLRGDGGDQVEFLCGEYRYQGRCGRCCWMPCPARSASRCSPASRNRR
ncbi:cupin domain-containing protein [Aeromonas hydrophila]